MQIDHMDFAERTGLIGERPPAPYLWTDVFAVCDFLELECRMGDVTYRKLAPQLIDRVHHVLGRHLTNNRGEGSTGGLRDGEGKQRPTRKEHEDINPVMHAASLPPEGHLAV